MIFTIGLQFFECYVLRILTCFAIDSAFSPHKSRQYKHAAMLTRRLHAATTAEEAPLAHGIQVRLLTPSKYPSDDPKTSNSTYRAERITGLISLECLFMHGYWFAIGARQRETLRQRPCRRHQICSGLRVRIYMYTNTLTCWTVLTDSTWPHLLVLGMQCPRQGLHLLGSDLCLEIEPTPWTFSIIAGVVILLFLYCTAWQRGFHHSLLSTSAAGRPLCPCRLQLSESQVDAGFACYRVVGYMLTLGNLHHARA